MSPPIQWISDATQPTSGEVNSLLRKRPPMPEPPREAGPNWVPWLGSMVLVVGVLRVTSMQTVPDEPSEAVIAELVPEGHGELIVPLHAAPSAHVPGSGGTEAPQRTARPKSDVLQSAPPRARPAAVEPAAVPRVSDRVEVTHRDADDLQRIDRLLADADTDSFRVELMLLRVSRTWEDCAQSMPYLVSLRRLTDGQTKTDVTARIRECRQAK